MAGKVWNVQSMRECKPLQYDDGLFYCRAGSCFYAQVGPPQCGPRGSASSI